MKVWQYQEMVNKVIKDLDLEDETFIDPVEMAGYFREAVTEAESEIHMLGTRNNYFKKWTWLPVVQGQSRYPLPPDIFANKVRGLEYTNGSIIYSIVQFKPRFEFEDIAYTDFYGQPDDYRYVLTNDAPGQTRLEFHPVSRETAILPPTYPYPDAVNVAYGGTFPNLFTPVKLWYLRNAQVLPIPTFNNIPGELRYVESFVSSLNGSAFTSVSVSGNTISLVNGLMHNDGFTPYVPGGIPYVTGDTVYFTPEPGAVLPAPLSSGTPYYIITTGTVGVYKLATSSQNAQSNTPLVLTTQGSGFIDVQLVTTQNILNNLLVDIPLAATFIMQWVKVKCLVKEHSPLVGVEDDRLEEQRKMMVDTLAEMTPDLDTEIEPDFSHYQEMS
jgi:hypothetical protein